MIKRLGKMISVLAMGSLVFACNGCSHVETNTMPAYEPTGVVTPGMSMAAPGLTNGRHVHANTTSDTLRDITSSVNFSANVAAPDAGQLAQNPSKIAVQSVTPDVRLNWVGLNDSNRFSSAGESLQNLNTQLDVQRDISAEVAINVPAMRTGLGFDVGVLPRVTLRDDGELNSRRIGGELRIGKNFDQRGTNAKPAGAWYMFVAADGEALTWEGQNMGLNDGGLTLRDQITVGDLQAGVSVKHMGGDLSLSVMRREFAYSDRSGRIDHNENFAGISFTRRH